MKKEILIPIVIAGLNLLFLLTASSNCCQAKGRTVTLSFVDSLNKPLPNTIVYIQHKIFTDYIRLLKSDSLGRANVNIPVVLYYFPFSTYQIKTANAIYDQMDTSMSLKKDTVEIMLKESNVFNASGKLPCFFKEYAKSKKYQLNLFIFPGIVKNYLDANRSNDEWWKIDTTFFLPFHYEITDTSYFVNKLPKGEYYFNLYKRGYFTDNYMIINKDTVQELDFITIRTHFNTCNIDQCRCIWEIAPMNTIWDLPDKCAGVLKSE